MRIPKPSSHNVILKRAGKLAQLPSQRNQEYQDRKFKALLLHVKNLQSQPK